jgi:hypothetical protein
MADGLDGQTADAVQDNKVPRLAKVIFLIAFVLIFFIALLFTWNKFPAHRVSNNISITVLAYSIHVAAFCGIAVFLIEAIHGAFLKTKDWDNGWALMIYIVLTVIPVVWGINEVGELAAELREVNAEGKPALLHRVERRLDFIAPAIVFSYLLADCIGWLFGKSKHTFSWLLPCDTVVLGCHGIALLLLWGGQSVWLFGDFPDQTRAGLYAGIIAIVLLLQNVAFAIITSLKR